MGYCVKKFIAREDCPSTSTVVAYCGEPSWKDKDRPDQKDKFLEVSSCYETIRLHQTDIETDQDFINKLLVLRDEIDLFISYLERIEHV